MLGLSASMGTRTDKGKCFTFLTILSIAFSFGIPRTGTAASDHKTGSESPPSFPAALSDHPDQYPAVCRTFCIPSGHVAGYGRTDQAFHPQIPYGFGFLPISG